ncbi:uncharacterized protein LOC125677910 isoform X2 [Ostrea edulis]|uniref:uncharacterized protein LOC125677910 isoform X2 n=1 Tax=Ostrea edulis TaxID=37623 RepID=UPI0024AF4DC5|nr:uncharacterized protein LOC125677910 isoform X2 [Ostrea edulis]
MASWSTFISPWKGQGRIKKEATKARSHNQTSNGWFLYHQRPSRKGGTSRFLDSPVYTSLKLYAEVVLKMCSASFNSAWNEKLSSARRTQKRLAAQEPSEGPSVGQ